MRGCRETESRQRDVVVRNPRLGWVEMALGLPEGPSHPGHTSHMFGGNHFLLFLRGYKIS